MKELFVKFLQKNGCYEQFVENLKTFGPMGYTLEQYLAYTNKVYYVDGAFYFSDTPQGHFFWVDINRKWRLLLKEIERN